MWSRKKFYLVCAFNYGLMLLGLCFLGLLLLWTNRIILTIAVVFLLWIIMGILVRYGLLPRWLVDIIAVMGSFLPGGGGFLLSKRPDIFLWSYKRYQKRYNEELENKKG